MYRLIFKPFAEDEATQAALWYNDKSSGLGNDFLLALDAKINAIQRNPTQFQEVYKSIRRAVISRFPFGVFFTIENDTIYILAVLHTSRNPKIWKGRK
jgi:toxin ParE1/3/4